MSKTINLIVLALVFLSQSHKSYTQPKALDGNWQGVLTQPNNKSTTIATSYVFYMDFRIEKDSIYGLSRIEVANTDNFGIIEFHASIKDDTVKFQETKITDENIFKGAFWCIKRGVLVLSDDKKSLKGVWSSTKTCGPGEVYLTKIVEPFNDSTAEDYSHITLEKLEATLDKGGVIESKKVILNNIYFERSKSDLLDSSIRHIEPLLRLMERYSKLKIKITGHTESAGNDILNQKLSEARAKTVRLYLISKNVKRSRIITQGFGESRPVAPNDTEANRKLNRRIEFEVIKK